MDTTADVGRNEVETVCRQSAHNKINIAFGVGTLTVIDLIKDIGAELLETLVVNNALVSSLSREVRGYRQA